MHVIFEGNLIETEGYFTTHQIM